MQYLIGALIPVVFFLCLYTAFWMGKIVTKKPSAPSPLTDEERERQKEVKRYNKHFKALFSYDTDTALQRKKVT